MTMWFYDDYGDMEGFQTFRKESLALEKDYLEVRKALREAEQARRADPDNENLQARVEHYQKRMKDLERQAPWLAADMPMEYMLWGSPH